MEQTEVNAFNECYKRINEYETKKNKSNSLLKDYQIEM